MEFKRENHSSAKLMPPKFVLAPLFHRTANLDPTKRDFNTERRDSHTECSSFTSITAGVLPLGAHSFLREGSLAGP